MRSINKLAASVSIAILVFFAQAAVAQQKSMKDQLVGSWMFTGSSATLADGSPVWGSSPAGLVIFEANGVYANILMRSDLPKFASNNRLTGTPDENKAIIHGINVTFGTYTFDEVTRSFVIHVQGSSFPNWKGTDQKRTILLITADELRINNPAPSTGVGSSDLIYRRVK